MKTIHSLQAGSIMLALFVALSNIYSLHGSEASENQAKLNGGYFLLYQLCGEEAQLPMLTDIKHTPPDLAEFVIRISKTSKKTSAALEEMQDREPAIRLDKNPLPPIERDVRESIADAKQHQLLFGTKDLAFVHAVLISQIEASSYALNLAKVLSSQESDPGRSKRLDRIEEEWRSILSEAYRRLQAE